jgi:hypothetical protein
MPMIISAITGLVNQEEGLTFYNFREKKLLTWILTEVDSKQDYNRQSRCSD